MDIFNIKKIFLQIYSLIWHPPQNSLHNLPKKTNFPWLFEDGELFEYRTDAIGGPRTSNPASPLENYDVWVLTKGFLVWKKPSNPIDCIFFGALGLAASALSRFLNILAFMKDLKNHGSWFKIVITRVWYKGFYSETEIFFLHSILQSLCESTFRTSFECVQLEMEAIVEMTITIKTHGMKNLESLF